MYVRTAGKTLCMRSLYIYQAVLVEYWRYRLIHLKIIYEATYVLLSNF